MGRGNGESGISFAVDDVRAVSHGLPHKPAATVLEGLAGRAFSACWDPERALVSPDAALENGLVATVHHAFSEHRKLSLSPDAIWLTIAQGFAQHLNEHAGALRADLVDHRGKAIIRVPVIAPPATGLAWQTLIEAFCEQLAERHPDLAELVTCDFSTSGSTERIASQVVLMDSLESYYDYVAACICGIPEITLEGTLADWKEIARRARELERYGLEFWTAHLNGICDQFVRARQGDVDLEHWQAIYKRRTGYGTTHINGWISQLFPYIGTGSTPLRNPALAGPPLSYLRVSSSDDFVGFAGIDKNEPLASTWISSADLPNGLRSATIHLLGPEGTGQIYDVIAGVVGYEETDESLRPVVGWGVLEPTTVARLIRRLGPSIEKRACKELVRWSWFALPADAQEFWDAYDGATLSGPEKGEITLLSRRGFRALEWRDESSHGSATVIARSDASAIAVMSRDNDWPILVRPGKRGGDDSIDIVARSFTHFLDQVATTGDALFFARDDYEPLEELDVSELEEETLDPFGFDPVTGLTKGPGDAWDGDAAAWLIEESAELRCVIAVDCGHRLEPAQARALRDLDDGLKTVKLREAFKRLKRLGSLELGPVSMSRADAMKKAIDKAGLSYQVTLVQVGQQLAIYRANGKILDLCWDERGETLAQMKAFGVEVFQSKTAT